MRSALRRVFVSQAESRKPEHAATRREHTALWKKAMPKPIPIDSVTPDDLCSRGEFKAQRDKLESLLREASKAALSQADVPAAERRRAETTLERDVEQRLQRLILRAKGIVSEEMLVRHQREIAVDEIPDYAVTHLLVELGEQELRS
jgi:hypothetical protein